MAGPAVVAANIGGSQQVMVMGLVNQPLFLLMGRADITRVEDLRGKTVGVTKVGSSDDFLLRTALTRSGLKPDADVKISGISAPQGRIAAIEQGLVQGVMVGVTDELPVRKVGGHVLVRTADLGIQYQAAGIATTRDYIQARPDIVGRVAKSVTQGIHRYKTDKPFALQVLSKYIRIDDPEALESNYNAYVDVFPRVPAPTLAGMRQVAGELAADQTGAVPDVTTMIDASFVQTLDDSGFIQRLYEG
jgi:NitT/TauT family transport system substrate-binding protein